MFRLDLNENELNEAESLFKVITSIRKEKILTVRHNSTFEYIAPNPLPKEQEKELFSICKAVILGRGSIFIHSKNRNGTFTDCYISVNEHGYWFPATVQ